MTELIDVFLGGAFHAAVLFLVSAGLQLVFGVQKIVNLACGSFYALGAYFGITAVGLAIRFGMPPALFFPVLIVAGLASVWSVCRSSGCCARSIAATRAISY
jgi:branched-chain amino acid transport system permease protein